MENERIVLRTNGNTGIGLWTCICKSFSDFFGVYCKHFEAKQQILLGEMVKKLNQKIRVSAKNYKPVAIDLWFNGPLSASMSVTLEKTEKEYQTVIDYFSSNCGVGFWTSICMFFASIAGKQSKRLQRKMDQVLKSMPKNTDGLVESIIRKPSALNVI